MLDKNSASSISPSIVDPESLPLAYSFNVGGGGGGHILSLAFMLGCLSVLPGNWIYS